MLRVLDCVTQEHDLALVLLAAVVCLLGALSALQMLGRAQVARRAALRWAWTLAAAFAASLTVWSTHFIAMIGFHPPVPITYDASFTAASIVIALLLTALSFMLAVRWPARRLLAGLVAGGGIAAMHYAGMAALRAPAVLSYDPALVAASVLLGMSLAAAALSNLAPTASVARSIASGALFAIAIGALHFIGMAAAVFRLIDPGNAPVLPDEIDPPAWLPFALAIAVVAIALLGVVGAAVDRHVVARATSESSRLASLVDARTAELQAMNIELGNAIDLLVAREAENSKLAAIARLTRAAVVVQDACGRIEWVNPAFQSLFEYAMPEVVGRIPRSVLGGAATDRRTLAHVDERARRGCEVDFEIVAYTKPGRSVWLDVSTTPVTGSDGEVRQFISVARDITERKAVQERLQAAVEREREILQHQRQFIATASHEFRTPLAIIDSASQRLAARTQGRPELARHIEGIRAAIARMTDLIDRTLSSARLEDGELEFQPRSLRVSTVLRAVIERQAQATPGYDIRLDVPDGEPATLADPVMLEQVFDNLLSNAIKYSANSRAVDLRVRLTDNAISVAVQDRGIGIPADDLPKLFKRFFRARSAIGIAGTGVGLSHVARLVAAHRGTIAVDSELGLGSTFTVQLPVVPGDPRHATQAGA
ncbi:MAG: PAS domain S-box protein [Alphaproteobacteria bacterium]|nr:PAS domain S-box protein [Alphaproteobacteria bacterium]